MSDDRRRFICHWCKEERPNPHALEGDGRVVHHRLTHRRVLALAVLIALLAASCGGRDFDFEEGAMANYGLPAIGERQAVELCSLAVSENYTKGTVLFRVRTERAAVVQELLKEGAIKDPNNSDVLRVGDAWTLQVENEQPVRIRANVEGSIEQGCE